MSQNNKWLAVLAVLLIASIGVNAFLTLGSKLEPTVPPLQPNEPPPPVDIPVDVPPVAPVDPVTPPLDLVPVIDPVAPRLADEPLGAVLKVTNTVDGKTSTGSGLMVRAGDQIVAITSTVLFVNGIGEVEVTGVDGTKRFATRVARDKAMCVAALRFTNLDGAVYTQLAPHSFQVGDKNYWAFGYDGKNFSGGVLYVNYHPMPTPSWTVFIGSDDAIHGTYFGGPILDPDGRIAGMLLGRATQNGRIVDSQLGINSTQLRAFLGSI